MRIVFFGTPNFAVPALRALSDSGYKIPLVVTQPDKPGGRGLTFLAPPVKKEAMRLNLPVAQPDSLLAPEIKKRLTEILPDTVTVVAYGKIIPKWLLGLPQFGCINVHPSLLPEYRGAAPIQKALMEGQKITGVTTMLMDEGMDTGSILLQREVSIFDEETAGELEARLSKLGTELLLDTLKGFQEGSLTPKKQDESKATYASKIEKSETLIDWSRSAEEIKNLIRALNPHPGAYTFYKNKRIKVWRAQNADFPKDTPSFKAGSVLLSDDKMGLVIACGEGNLLLTEIQPEGRPKMSGTEFCRGHKIQVNELFG